MATLDAQIASGGIQRVALGRHGQQSLAAICCGQQRSAVVIAQSRKLLLHINVQVDHETPLAEQLAVACIQHDAPAAGQQHATLGATLLQHFAFAGPETGLALVLENERDPGTRVRLDFAVKVHKLQVKAACQTAPHGRFSGTHGADKKQVARWIHAAIVTRNAGDFGIDESLMLKFAILFPVYLIVLFVLELLAPIDKHVIAPWTSFLADVSAWLMHTFDSKVAVHGNIVASTTTGFAIAIERGCNGVEAVIILVAAMLAYPARWGERLLGILIGFFCVQAVNLVRIISLFYLGNWNRTWFDWFHLYVWQALIVLDALVVFLIWLSWIRRRELARRDGGDQDQEAIPNPA